MALIYSLLSAASWAFRISNGTGPERTRPWIDWVGGPRNVNGSRRSCVVQGNLLHIIRVDSINKYIFIELDIGKRVMLA